MEPLRIGQHTLPVSHPHILYARGLLGIYNDIPAERWMLDFYIDIANATVNPQSLDFGIDEQVRFFLPTIGVKAVL